MDIRFRCLSISDEQNDVSGIALCYNTMAEAESLFNIVVSGCRSNAFSKINIEFQRQKSHLFNMDMLVKGDENFYKINLQGVEWQYVNVLKKSLEKNGYIFIVTAVSKIVSEFKLNKKKYCCVSEISIDGKRITGNINSSTINLVEQFVNS